MKIVFTAHAEQRTEKRKLLRQEIIDAIKYPDRILKKYGKYYFQKKLDRGTVEVCCVKTESDIRIITVWWN